MKTRLAYGKEGLAVELPDHATLIEPEYIPSLPDETGALKTALRNPIGTIPLRQATIPGQKVGISVCDITRPMPSDRILPVLLGELAHIPPSDITIFLATGTHRSNTDQEIKLMLGDFVVKHGCKIVNHDAFDSKSLACVGITKSGIPVFLNKEWVGCDFRITTGFVEPHFFAGFSGGPKMVAPGLAGFDTTMALHSAEMISHPDARWGVTKGNPIHDSIREIARMKSVNFSLDVTINKNRGITSVYAGNLFEVHRAASRFALSTAMQGVNEPFDVVVTTNSGYPLDMNLYQAVKGMSAASQIVKKGGSIICVAECSDGIPNHGRYYEILTSAESPAALLDMINTPGFNKHDQWQVQIQALIQAKSNVYLKSGFLSNSQVKRAHLIPVEDVAHTVNYLMRKTDNGTICVLPEGPQTIPFIRN